MWIPNIALIAASCLCAGSAANSPQEPDAALDSFHYAVRHNDLEGVREHLAAGVNPNQANASGELALDLVESPEMVELLVDQGADPLRSGPRSAGRPLSRKLRDDGRPRFQSIAAAFVKVGVPCDIESAVRYGWKDEIRRLLPVGPPAEDRPASLLYLALQFKRDDVLLILLGRGVATTGAPPPCKIINWSYPRSVLEYAAHVGSTKDQLALLSAGAPVRPEAIGWSSLPRGTSLPLGRFLAINGDLLDRAIDEGCVELYDQLVARGLDPHVRKRQWGSSTRSTPAIQDRALRAAWRGHDAILDRLLAATSTAPPRDRETIALGALLLAAASAGHGNTYDKLRFLAQHRTLHAPAALGRMEELRSLIADELADPFQKDLRCGASPLAWAVLCRRSEAVALLLEEGADPNEVIRRDISSAIWDGAARTQMPFLPYCGPHPGEISLLEHALRSDDFSLAQTLLEAGARVDSSALGVLATSTSPNATELLRAAIESERVATDSPDWASNAFTSLLRSAMPQTVAVERLRLMLHMKASRSFQNTNGSSVLSAATWRQGTADVAVALRDAGAPVPPDVAFLYDWSDEVEAKRWIESLDPDDLKSLFHRAAAFPGVKATRKILEARPYLDGSIIVDQIQKVAYKGRLDLLDVLLERAPEDYDYRADSKVLCNGAGSPEFVRALLDRGADPNASNFSGTSALHRAASAGSSESIRQLLAAGASPLATAFKGDSPLSRVATAIKYARGREEENEAAECIRLLLESGADPLHVDGVGRVTFERLLYSTRHATFRAKIRAQLRPFVRSDWLE